MVCRVVKKPCALQKQVLPVVIDNVVSFTFGRRWWLDVGDPRFGCEPVDESGPVVVVLQISVSSGQFELASGTCLLAARPSEECPLRRSWWRLIGQAVFLGRRVRR